MDDLISRQAAIDVLSLGKEILSRVLDDMDVVGTDREKYSWGLKLIEANINDIEELPSAQPEERTETHACDCVSRQAALDALKVWVTIGRGNGKSVAFKIANDYADIVRKRIETLPSAQPERTCVNCGRTVNNGGWYADGRTRCPIEEHYALPKDGYCHLWEKRNVTDDDYPERREDERPES